MPKRKKSSIDRLFKLNAKERASERKAKEGYSDVGYEETWNMDEVLAKIIAQKLRGFLKVVRESPYGGYPGELKSAQEWYNILRKMIYAFEEYKRPLPYPDTPEDEEDEEEQEVYWAQMRQRDEKDAERQERIKEGMQLFVDYFQNLWW